MLAPSQSECLTCAVPFVVLLIGCARCVIDLHLQSSKDFMLGIVATDSDLEKNLVKIFEKT